MGYWNNTASPTKVTWANPQVTPEAKRQNGGWYYNPQSGYVEQWWSGESSGGGSQPQQTVASTADQYVQQIKQTLETVVQKQFGAESASDKYLKANPFSFDDAWLAATEKQVRDEIATEPYYKEKLSNYLDDVKTKKDRAQEDTATLLTEMDRQEKLYRKEEATAFQQAREKALEGQSGAGILDAGVGMREKNLGDISRTQSLEDYGVKQNLAKQQQQTAQSRLLSDLETGSSRFSTDLEREKQQQVVSELQKRKGEKLDYWKAGFTSATGQIAPGIYDYLTG